MCYLFIEVCVGNHRPWIEKESNGLGKTIKRDSNVSDSAACKGMLAICMYTSYMSGFTVKIVYRKYNNTFHSTHSVIRLLK